MQIIKVVLIEQISTAKRMTLNNSMEKLEKENVKIVCSFYNLTEGHFEAPVCGWEVGHI